IRANVGAAQLPPCTAITLPPPPLVGRGELIKQASRMRFGRDRSEIESSWIDRVNPPQPVTAIGRKRTGT
ncbi:MAG: hypothetical protein ACYDD7_08165, partial [Acidimicrobiales bacterium]